MELWFICGAMSFLPLLAIAVAWTTEDIRREYSRDNHRRYPRADCHCVDCLIARGDI